MKLTMVRTAMLVASTALMMATPALAQAHNARNVHASDKPDGEEPQVVAQFKTEVGRHALDYWTEKLNTYKVKIDAALPPADLAELNSLRARWGIIMSQMFQRKNVTTSAGEGTGTDENGLEENVDISIDGEGMLDHASDVLEIYTEAKAIAARNAVVLGGLRQTVGFDVGTFLDDVMDMGQRYRQAHRAEIEATRSQSEFDMFSGSDADSLAGKFRSEKGQRGFQQIYAFGIEPMVYLYNGMELREILAGAVPAAAPIAGLPMPESAVLKQNFPNPAATSTTIGFTLPASSDRTTLRVFDAKGAVAMTQELGAQSAGEHAIPLDVSSLAAGTYLYQLTTSGSRGEQVYSKAMQVVR
jgi:hypothetical protein